MRLPAGVRDDIEATLREGHTGESSRIAAAEPVGGGCISQTARLRTGEGRSLFAKWSVAGEFPADLYRAEAEGLAALRATGTVRVPEVLGVADEWLLLEWLEPGRASEATWQELGRGLAQMHRRRAEQFGGPADNYIGSLPQSNRPSDDWPAFWRDERLLPQLERARRLLGASDHAKIRRFAENRLEELLRAGNEDGASLLHGDLWSGNVHPCADGRAALLDPSCYRGHREVDLAMASLFGGIDGAFFDAYAEAWPLASGYAERRAAYQLYYLLVHVNLFGGGYIATTLRALRHAGG